MFKIGDKVIRQIGSWDEVKVGHTYVVRSQNSDGIYLDELSGLHLLGCYDERAFVLTNQAQAPNYASAFNAWMDDYVNNPQAYESNYDTAMRHVSEKLGGYEPSYGEVCAEVLVNYLNKLESK